jgi:hypothetical protein
MQALYSIAGLVKMQGLLIETRGSLRIRRPSRGCRVSNLCKSTTLVKFAGLSHKHADLLSALNVEIVGGGH